MVVEATAAMATARREILALVRPLWRRKGRCEEEGGRKREEEDREQTEEETTNDNSLEWCNGEEWGGS